MVKKLLLGLAVFVFGLIIGLYIFPDNLSAQKPIDPQNLVGDYSPDEKVGYFHGAYTEPVYIPPKQIVENFNSINVLGASTSNKRIEVDLTNQRIYAYEGSNRIYDFSISSGKWGRTPTGEFQIWIKLRYTKMEGGSKAINTYYYLPNVPYVMYFYNDEIPKWRGFGIHGAYWHNNFGHPMSHGCINMKIDEAGILYYWAEPNLGEKSSIYASADNPGTRIIIYGTAP